MKLLVRINQSIINYLSMVAHSAKLVYKGPVKESGEELRGMFMLDCREECAG